MVGRKGAWLLPAALLAACASPARRAPAAPHEAAADARATITLVESAPVETSLDHADVPNAADVWPEMIDGATRTLDVAEFYASEAEGPARATSRLAPVIEAVERAAARGVRVRFLADASFAGKYPDTLAELARAGVTVRRLDMNARTGGVLHAKYFVVDGEDAFLGSQNFDWRALAHIQEMGVRVRSRAVARALLDVFDADWAFAGGAEGVAAHAPVREVRATTGERLTLVATPRGLLPDERSFALPALVSLLEGARRQVDLQVLSYATMARDGRPFPTLDDALRRAAARGVRVRVLVSSWGAKDGSAGRRALASLDEAPNVEVRVLTIPRWSGGDVPFARVAHAKYLVVDSRAGSGAAWVGTSNWKGEYFTQSRNVGVVARGGALPSALDRVFESGWSSPYARSLSSTIKQ